MANLMSAWEKMSVLFTLNELPTQQTTSPYSCMIVIISCTAEQSKGKLEVLLYTAILCSSFLPSFLPFPSLPFLPSVRPSIRPSLVLQPSFFYSFIQSINQSLFFLSSLSFFLLLSFLFFHSFFFSLSFFLSFFFFFSSSFSPIFLSFLRSFFLLQALPLFPLFFR